MNVFGNLDVAKWEANLVFNFVVWDYINPVKIGTLPLISSLNCHYNVCCHFATTYEWKFLNLLFRDEVVYLLQVEKFESTMNFF